ncbi:hypothetical protein EJ03DRAFT_332323 [Teratosphaeria nubilosa]|uniref:Uncharacterized protein n=1 Tax=Teratosphaeria nubilosa TaxID=161662 RepID=A0A6G1KUD3_9PEZI|nr:hypothetical protein EJ03DRAFT_332323 [Teratosphaeria nubilosa]
MATEGLYNKIQTAATGFVLSTSPNTPGTNEVDADRFYSYLGPGFHMSWGHKFFVSTKPPLQKPVDGPAFIAHPSGMATSLQTWETRVTNSCVDVQQRGSS